MSSVRKFFSGVIRLVRKLAGDEAGSPAVEFALVFPIFIAVVLATMQAGSIFLVKAFFETWAEQAARVVLTNQAALNDDGSAVQDRNLQSADRALQLRRGDSRTRAYAHGHDKSQHSAADIRSKQRPDAYRSVMLVRHDRRLKDTAQVLARRRR